MSYKRSKARQFAFQAIYQWQMTAHDLTEIANQFAEDNNLNKIDKQYFHELILNVPNFVDKIDPLLQQYMERKVASVDPVERAILRLASYEMLERQEIAVSIILNEAIELAKKYGADKSYRFVNGVLDKLGRELRPHDKRFR